MCDIRHYAVLWHPKVRMWFSLLQVDFIVKQNGFKK